MQTNTSEKTSCMDLNAYCTKRESPGLKPGDEESKRDVTHTAGKGGL